ncbi:MAG: hypothetical protein HC873_20460 [Leptolyngbyaceae cyanobacterium SL_1_1]|nr:hypothetical protein [Leptolyngbyaceae cyanobacterium RM1_1_2]NJO11612.1 hypothetical protein [Leptolyngbyaceae cyanobacterium SL_1_1]
MVFGGKLVAVVMVANLLLVFFNITYISLRDLYVEYFPVIVHQYDPIKGIEPNEITEGYLETVSMLEAAIARDGVFGTKTAAVLKQLQNQSLDMMDDNPFLMADKTAAFARLKRKMRFHTGAESNREAFLTFWSPAYIKYAGWPNAKAFFEQSIRPLIASNYFRETNEIGQFVDEFWRIDIYFVAFFAIEFLLRTAAISRQNLGVSWLDAIARRWYELPLFLPFWHWLRIVPTAVRVHRSSLFNLERLLSQITHEPAAYLAERVSRFALVRMVNQAKEAVNAAGLIDANAAASGYVQVGDIKKVDKLTDRLLRLVIYQVMPTIKPDLEALLRHSLQKALRESDLYEGLQQIPGIQAIPQEMVAPISDYLAQTTCDVLADSYADVEGRVLVDQLSDDFRHALGRELTSGTTQTEMKTLLSDLLEEVKLNYIQRSKQKNPEETLEEVDQLEDSSLIVPN